MTGKDTSSLLRDTAHLVGGAVGGRVIVLLALPLIARLFGPDDFELLAVFLALISTVSVMACLRFDIAIPLAETDAAAANLLALSLMSAAAASGGVLMLAVAGPVAVAAALGTPQIAPHLWLVAFGILLTASYSALQFWATRLRRFGIIGRTRLIQAVTGVATMLGLGWLGLAPLGLLVGNVLTLGAGGVSLATQALRHDGTLLRGIRPATLRQTFRNHRRYPVFSAPEALANVAGMQVPVVMIAAVSGSEAGQLFLAMQVMAAPLVLIGASVGQVYASRARQHLRDGTLHGFTVSMMRRLFLIGILPLTAAAVLAPFLFAPIFGGQWQRAGELVAWVAPWMLMQLSVSPVSMALHVTDHHAIALSLQMSGFFLRVGMVAVLPGVMPIGLGETYAISGVMFYGLSAIVILGVLRNT